MLVDIIFIPCVNWVAPLEIYNIAGAVPSFFRYLAPESLFATLVFTWGYLPLAILMSKMLNQWDPVPYGVTSSIE